MFGDLNFQIGLLLLVIAAALIAMISGVRWISGKPRQHYDEHDDSRNRR